MIVIKSGDLFSSKLDCLVNPVNSVGVMGKGLAKTFADLYPNQCHHYNDVSMSFQVSGRTVTLMRPVFYSNTHPYVLMFPTKVHWRDPSKYSYIRESAKQTMMNLELQSRWPSDQWPSLAFPAVGCGLGGLTFDKVCKILIEEFSDYPKDIEIYEP